MANFMDKVKSLIMGPDEYEEDNYSEQEEESTYETRSDAVTDIQTLRQKRMVGSRYANVSTSTQMNVVVTKPLKYEDAQNICNHVRSKNPVVINLEGLEQPAAQRIMDFLSGVCYSLDGDLQKVADKIFIIAPENVDISTNFKIELEDAGLLSWASGK